MKEVNNFLNSEDFLKIKNTLLHDTFFPWFLQNGIARNNDGDIQFTHLFYNDEKPSIYFEVLRPILNKLKIKKLLRIKANLVPKSNKLIQHDYHVDYPGLTCTTAIFYINSNDGYTIFKKNKKIIKSEENKFVYFKSSLEHAGTTCTDKKIRSLINLNYIE